MKKFLLFIITIFLVQLTVKAAPELKYVGITPSDNSEISSFSFDLEFDFSEVINELGENPDYGIMINGSSKRFVSIYQGDAETGTLIASGYNQVINGVHADFKTGNKVHLEFPDAQIIDGQIYTLLITNQFSVMIKGEKKPVSTVISADYKYQFIGKSAQDSFSFKSWNNVVDIEGEKLSPIKLEFTKPISISVNGNVILVENGHTLKKAELEIDNANPKVVIATFSNVLLRKGHSYQVVVEEGTVCDNEDSSQSNIRLIYPGSITGTHVDYFEMTNYEIERDSYGLPVSINIEYDIDTDNVSGFSNVVPLKIFDETDNQVASMTWSKTEMPKVIYKLPISSLVAGKSFKIVVKEGEIVVYGKFSSGNDESYINNPFEITFSTPAFGEVQGLPSVEFMSLGLPEFNYRETQGLSQPYSTKRIDKVEIAFKDYIFEGKEYNDITARRYGESDTFIGELYEITTEGEILVKKFSVGSAKRGTNGLYLYPVLVCYVQEDLLNGKTYKLVIPENMVRPRGFDYENYVQSPRYEFIFKGLGGYEFQISRTTIKDGDTIDELINAIWEFDNTVSISEGATATFKNNNSDKSYTGLLSATQNMSNTIVRADFTSWYTGAKCTTDVASKWTLILPEGAVTHPSDATIICPEQKISVNFIPEVVSTDPEFVNTTVTLADNETNEAHSFIVKSAKGYPAEIQMLPGDNWNIADVAHEGKSLSAVNGVYTSEPLTGDSKIVATLAFNKDMQFDQTTGVYSVEDTNIKVYTENNQIVVSGLTQPTNIAVYSVGGILVKQMTTDAAYDMVRISAEPNEIYVVVINGQAAKVRL